jgi:hypothetical protein
MNKNKTVALTEKEAIFICDFISHIEQCMPWAYDFFSIDEKTLINVSDKIYKKTEEYKSSCLEMEVSGRVTQVS